ncbi:MAG: pimeloyl-ACP methyl ester carboxylesterase [Saprospiraceae bacterium]|jgi:pimeloyl-ACP methyl ester carboxylesterase
MNLKKITRITLTVVSVLFITFVSLMYLFQDKLIFAGTTLPQDYEYSFDEPFEELNFTTEDGNTINGLYFTVPEPDGAIVYFHGNAGDLSRWGNNAAYYTQFNYNVLIIDYRTYGKSSGTINEQKMLDDTQLPYNFLLGNFKEEDIVIYGRSLGTSFASYLASKNKPRKLILETPFYNMLDVTKRRFPLIPFAERLLKYKMESNAFVKSVSCPIIIYHGTNDDIVPLESGELLGEEIPEAQLTFYTIQGGTHHNLGSFELYKKTILKSLSDLPISKQK